MPTPAGVPVRIRSPGSKVNTVEACATIAGTPKIGSAVEESCKASPFTRWTIRRPEASPSSSTPTMARRIRQKESKLLSRSHWPSLSWRSRALTSFAHE
jgi:hypothetical protein